MQLEEQSLSAECYTESGTALGGDACSERLGTALARSGMEEVSLGHVQYDSEYHQGYLHKISRSPVSVLAHPENIYFNV